MSFYDEIPYILSLKYVAIYIAAIIGSGCYVYFSGRNDIVILSIVGIFFSIMFLSVLIPVYFLVCQKIIIELNNNILYIVFFNKYFSSKAHNINLDEIVKYSEERYRTQNPFFSKGEMIFTKQDGSIIKVGYSDFYQKIRTDILNIIGQYDRIKIENLCLD